MKSYQLKEKGFTMKRLTRAGALFLAVVLIVSASTFAAAQNYVMQEDDLLTEELIEAYAMLDVFGYEEIVASMMQMILDGNYEEAFACRTDWIMSLEGSLPDSCYSHLHNLIAFSRTEGIPAPDWTSCPIESQLPQLFEAYRTQPGFMGIEFIYDDNGNAVDYIARFEDDYICENPIEVEDEMMFDEEEYDYEGIISNGHDDLFETHEEYVLRCVLVKEQDELAKRISEEFSAACSHKWGAWQASAQGCFRICSTCKRMDPENGPNGHHISEQIDISLTLHRVQCSRCKFVRNVGLAHTWPAWTRTSTQHTRRCNGNPCNRLHPQSGSHVWAPGPANLRVCSVCGWTG